MEANPYESPHEFSAPRLAIEPIDFRPWRLFFAFHLTLVVATLIATLIDMGYFGQFGEQPAPGIRFLLGCLFLAVNFGILVPFCVAPIAMLILFIRAVTHDKRYALAGISELFLTGAHLFIALPMCQ